MDRGRLDHAEEWLLLAGLGFGIVAGIFSAFLFTSSGKEEESTFGKIRDWMLAGITGAGAAEIMERGGSLRRFLELFSIGNQPGDLAMVVSTVSLGFGSGFFFMFFQRELNLNEQLAKARALTARAEGAKNASIVVQELLNSKLDSRPATLRPSQLLHLKRRRVTRATICPSGNTRRWGHCQVASPAPLRFWLLR